MRRNFGSVRLDSMNWSALWHEGGRRRRKRGFKTREEAQRFLDETWPAMPDGPVGPTGWAYGRRGGYVMRGRNPSQEPSGEMIAARLRRRRRRGNAYKYQWEYGGFAEAAKAQRELEKTIRKERR